MFQEELILCSFVKGGVRARGAKGGLPQIFEPPSFWRQQEKIWAEPVFKDVFMFFFLLLLFIFLFFLCFMYFLCLLLFYYFSCFLSFNLKSVQYSSYSGCLARDEFLVILGRLYVILHICIFLLFGTALAGMGYFRS